MSQDEGLLKAAKEGRDVYSSIAAIAFNTTYENCCEFNSDGTTNYEGKERRSQAKSIVLGRQMPLYKAICAEKYVNPITQGCAA